MIFNKIIATAQLANILSTEYSQECCDEDAITKQGDLLWRQQEKLMTESVSHCNARGTALLSLSGVLYTVISVYIRELTYVTC